MDAPSPEEVRQALAGFDTPRQKIVAGLFAVMIRSPEHVRDREWVARQLTEMVLLAGEFEADTPEEGVRVVQAYLHANAEELLQASYLLFQRVGLDLAAKADEGFDYQEAMRLAVGYLPV